MSTYGWGFHYAGPIAPTPDMKCTTCRAASTKECPTHEKSYADNCAHCRAAKGTAVCQSHWGLTAALEAHGKHLAENEPENAAEYEAARARVLAEPFHKKHTQVDLTMRSQGTLAETGVLEAAIEMKAR